MNRNLKVLGLALTAVMAFGVITAGAAQANAPRWKVEGSFLGSGAEKTFTATSETAGTLGTPALGVNFENPSGKCTSTGQIRGSVAGSPGTVTGATLTCTEVVVENAPTCVVRSPGQAAGTVKTNTLAGTLVWLNSTGGQAGVLFKPASGANFVVIEVEKCAAAGLYPVTKEIIGSLSPTEKEVEVGTFDFPTPAILNWWNNATPRVKQTIAQLAVKSQPATFDTTFNIELEPKEAVGVFPG